MTSESLAGLMGRLREEYLAEIPVRLDEMRQAVAAFAEGREPEGPPLAMLFHRLAGSAGTYGFGDVSAVCRETEKWLGTNPDRTDEARAQIERALAMIGESFRKGPTTEGIA